MTDREAIKHLANDWFRSEGGQLYVDGDRINDFLVAVGKGVFAIQEREERSRGCKWCNSGSFAPALHVDENRQLRQMHVEFCPMCGRPLKGADNGKNT